ncbi:MAG: hypothetical protein JSU96_05190 [Acidobacteriota bacterium]|nr:MAG: hypothetical protein JSU96_05190 [Acidobacteriota bacterium]
MRNSNSALMALRNVGIVAMLSILLAACGGSQTESTETTNEGTLSSEIAASTSSEAATEESSEGSVTFMVEGNRMTFEHLPKASNVYSALASTIRAHQNAGSEETLSITFMSIDLKKHTYPTDLPVPKTPGQPMDPMSAMASVGFSYTNSDGVEWAGPGKLRVEAFGSDGVVQGTFDNVSLPHTEKTEPNITLSGGKFSARITSPW